MDPRAYIETPAQVRSTLIERTRESWASDLHDGLATPKSKAIQSVSLEGGWRRVATA